MFARPLYASLVAIALLAFGPADAEPIAPCPEPDTFPLSLPVACDDFATTESGASVLIDVTENDFRNDSGNFLLTFVSSPDSGTVEVFDLVVEYTAPADFVGTTSFAYEITDNFMDWDGVDTAVASVFVTVTNPISVSEPDTLALVLLAIFIAAFRQTDRRTSSHWRGSSSRRR